MTTQPENAAEDDCENDEQHGDARVRQGHEDEDCICDLSLFSFHSQ